MVLRVRPDALEVHGREEASRAPLADYSLVPGYPVRPPGEVLGVGRGVELRERGGVIIVPQLREGRNASGRERYALTRPERLAKKREYYAAHREELLAKKHEYYLKNRLRICRDALERYVPDAVEKIAAQCPEAVAECAARWPYEDFEPGIRRCIARLGIRPGALEYDDCFEAGMLAWLYGVHRCALMGYEHVGAYVGRVTAILVRCAAAAALEAEAILAEHGLKRWELDRDGLPERY